jgi:uncharacterized protein YxeA
MKKILLISIIAAVVIGGVAVFLIINNQTAEDKVLATQESAADVSENIETDNSPITGKDTMSALMARGQNLECTVSYFSDSSTTTPTTGTFFTSQGRLRGDFLTPGLDEEVVSSMIMDKDNLYTWTVVGGEKYGMKISLTELEKSKVTDDKPEAREAVPMDEKVDYDCKVWPVVDGSVFVAPTDIIFRDYSDLMSSGMEYGTVYDKGVSEEGISIEGKSPCALCDEVEGEGQAECKAAFSCQ